MKKTLTIPTEQMHRVIIQYLLEETQRQLSLATRYEGIEDKLIQVLLEHNKSRLDRQFLAMVDQTQWWRGVRRNIEEAGLNHHTIARILGGKEVEI